MPPLMFSAGSRLVSGYVYPTVLKKQETFPPKRQLGVYGLVDIIPQKVTLLTIWSLLGNAL
jgi:hypothetical protein